MRVREKKSKPEKTAVGLRSDGASRSLGSDAARPGGKLASLKRGCLLLGRNLLVCMITYVATLPLFAPWSVWPLAYVAFVPWLLVCCLSSSTVAAYLASYLLGAAFFFTHWRWLFETTPPGYFAGCIAFSLYFPLAAWLIRHLYLRRRIPVTFGFAIAWILVEMMRSRGPLAFPWFLLGHTQIRLLSFVQIADITGVYGISFAVAMVNGLLADLLIRRRQRREAREQGTGNREPGSGAHAECSSVITNHRLTPLRAWPAAPITVVIALGGMFAYGWYRLTTLPIRPGPTAAVLQGDFLLKAEEDDNAPTDNDKQAVYLSLLNSAIARKPDLIVLPETPWSMYLNQEFRQLDPKLLAGQTDQQKRVVQYFMRQSQAWYNRFHNLAQQHGVTIVIGAMSQEMQPAGTYPSDLRYNSAFVFRPDGGNAARYDKIHPVLFGEYVPFRFSFPALYRWLNDNMTPFGQGGFEYSLTAGSECRVFGLAQQRLTPLLDDEEEHARSENAHAFGITICYEDVIPQVVRRFIPDSNGTKRADFMLNISNDGWFGHGAQQAQHLVNCAFRAIENRVGIARSVNTGVSGFVRPDGSWHDLVQPNAGSTEHSASSAPVMLSPGGTGYQIARIDCSPAITFYSRFGDIFGTTIALLACGAVVDAIVSRRREKRERRRQRNA